MRLYLLVSSITSLALSVAAYADSFNLNFGMPTSSFSGSGVLTTGTMVAPLEYTITSITGAVDMAPGGTTSSIESILAPGVFPTPENGGSFPANDNILFVTNGTGMLTEYGLSFLLRDGAQINLYEGGAGASVLVKSASGMNLSEAVPITITAVPAPEPSSFALLGTGLLAIAGVAKRRLWRC